MIDQGLRAIGWRPRPTPVGRLGAVAPVPFVGVAAILVALIVFTPVLLASGPSPLAVQAELTVYRAVGSGSADYGLHGLDGSVPYRWLNLSFGSGFSWTGGCPASAPSWSLTSLVNATGVSVVEAANPVVVNASAVYVQGGSRTVYAGVVALYVPDLNASSPTLDYLPCPPTPTVTSSGSWSVGSGTFPVTLVNFGAGGPP